MLDTLPKLEAIPFPAIHRGHLHTLQVNLGYRCNLQCKHCHVNAGPKRTEMMENETVEALFAPGRTSALQQRGLSQHRHCPRPPVVAEIEDCKASPRTERWTREHRLRLLNKLDKLR